MIYSIAIKCRYLFVICAFSFSAQLAFAQNKPAANDGYIDTTVKTIIPGSFLNKKQSVAFGPAQKRTEITSSVSSVSSSLLKSINTPNIGNTLFGRLAGLHVTQSGSAPGNNDAPGLSIRGRQTFQDNNVMVLVDGFETNWSNILVDEIETVTVLKDAAALAQYGMDGANGVVLITTKRGSGKGKTAINFSARMGVHSPTVMPKFLNNGNYAEMFNNALISDGKTIDNGLFKTQQIVDYYKQGNQPYLYPNTNWYTNVTNQEAYSQDYSLTFSGGGADAKYFVALGYADYDGIYKNSDKSRTINSNYNLKRYNIRANFDVNINRYISSEVNLRGTMMDKSFPNANEGTLWRSMALFIPYPIKTQSGAWGGTQGYAENPVATIEQRGYQTINDRTVDANVKMIGKLDFAVKGLQVFGQVNFHNFYYDTYNKTRGYAYDELIPRLDLLTAGNPIPYDVVSRGSTDKNFSITQGTGNQVNRTAALAGIEFNRTAGEHSIYASAIYMQEVLKADGSEAPFAKQLVMGRVTYNLKQKYFTEFGYSYAGSENFPKGSRFGFFPSLSAGWILSKEAFLKNSTAVNFLKLRGSAGLLGNDRSGNSGRFIFNQFYVGTGNYLLGNNLGISAPTFNQGTLANPDVTWEKAFRSNIGIEAVIAKRLSLAVDYFFEKRTDIFVNPSNYTSAILGISQYNANKGETQNTGVELELEWRDKVGAFEYYVGGNMTFAKNKILTIQEPRRPYDYLYAKGNAISQPFVLEAIGFFKDLSDIQNSPIQLFGNVQPGDIKYKDVNGDGFIDDNDRKPIGKTSYPQLFFGFNTGFSVKGFDLNIFVQGAGNRTVSLLDNNIIVPFLNGGVRPVQWVKNNYWTAQRGDAAKFPRLTTEANNNNYRPSTLWQRNGSFLRLRNVEFGYSFNEKQLQRLRMQSLRLFFAANNIVTWDKIKEIEVDPEIMNVFVHPPLKGFNFGINLGF
jgi:TonB-linked SusC/RagA family outer membrane protein